jgi:hypothetical protein
VEDGKKFYQVNGHPKQAGVAILISDKVDFKLNFKQVKKYSSF